jgi:hypothetical protein
MYFFEYCVREMLCELLQGERVEHSMGARPGPSIREYSEPVKIGNVLQTSLKTINDADRFRRARGLRRSELNVPKLGFEVHRRLLAMAS